MTKLKTYFLILLFLFISNFAFSNSDSLKSNKLFFLLPIYSGVSFGKNSITYGKGGRFAIGLGAYFEKKKILFGFDYFSTNFRDLTYPFETIGLIISSPVTHNASIISLDLGKHFGNYEKAKFNFNLTGGIGYQEYTRPIIVKNVDCMICLSKIKVQEYQVKKSIAVNATFKGYFNNKSMIRSYALVKISASPKINFLTINAGLELNTNKGFNYLFSDFKFKDMLK